MEIVFCTVVTADFANVIVVTQILFHDPNNRIKFDFILTEHCPRFKYTIREFLYITQEFYYASNGS